VYIIRNLLLVKATQRRLKPIKCGFYKIRKTLKQRIGRKQANNPAFTEHPYFFALMKLATRTGVKIQTRNNFTVFNTAPLA
jgi:hypothetical protein